MLGSRVARRVDDTLVLRWRFVVSAIVRTS